MDLKIFTDNIEQEALDQIHTLLSQDRLGIARCVSCRMFTPELAA